MRTLVQLTALVVAALAAAIIGPAPSAAAAPRKVVFTQSTEGFLYVPLYVARAKGYLADEGIDAEVIVTRGGSKAMAALIGGSAQVYLGAASSGAKAVAKGQPVVSFAAVMTQYGSNVVVQGDVARKRKITAESAPDAKIAALEGLRIGITSPGSGTDQLVRYMLETNGLDPDRDATIVPVGGSSGMLAAFAQKRIDAFALSSPTAETAVAEHGGVILFNLSRGEFEPLDGILYMSLLAKKAWLEQNPDLATGIVRAIARALTLINEKPDEAKAAVRGFFEKTDPAVFDRAWANNLKAYPPSPVIAQASIQKALDFINATEEKKISVTAAEAIDNRYAEAAVESLRGR